MLLVSCFEVLKDGVSKLNVIKKVILCCKKALDARGQNVRQKFSFFSWFFFKSFCGFGRLVNRRAFFGVLINFFRVFSWSFVCNWKVFCKKNVLWAFRGSFWCNIEVLKIDDCDRVGISVKWRCYDCQS